MSDWKPSGKYAITRDGWTISEWATGEMRFVLWGPRGADDLPVACGAFDTQSEAMAEFDRRMEK